MAKRTNEPAGSGRVVPASVAYREAYARRRRQLRRQRQLVTALVLLVALAVAGGSYALRRNVNRVRVIQVSPSPPATTTVTVAAGPSSPPQTSTSRVSGAPASAPSTPIGGGAQVFRPPIVWKPIPFSTSRRTEMAAYPKRHYGINSWRLVHPHVIVEHYTASSTFPSAFNTFARTLPTPSCTSCPAPAPTSSSTRDGTIYQLVPLTTMCRHTVGLNYTAIGIEHVGTSDARDPQRPAPAAAPRCG